MDVTAQRDSASVFSGPGKYTATYSARDCFRARKYQSSFRPDSVKPNYIMKGTRIWRSVSLDNKQNEQILNTNSSNCTDLGLFEIIKFGAFEKQLHLFSSDNFDQAKFTMLSKDAVFKLITVNDSSAIPSFDANGDPVAETSSVKKYRMGSDVKSYLIKEDWIISSYNGKTEKYIIGIAPLVYDEGTGKTVPLFWLYYPEWKSLFAAFSARNFYSDEAITFDDIFRRRYFVSQISKESNIFDRSQKSYRHGDDVLMENQLIQERLNNSQADLFPH